MADDKNTNNPGGPAADSADFRQYSATYKEYKQTKATQEVLEKSLQQYAQEGQEIQEVLAGVASSCEFDPETGAIIVSGQQRPELDPNSPQFDPVQYNEYANAINNRLKASLEQMRAELEAAAKGANFEAVREMLANISEQVAPVLQNVTQAVANIVNSDVYKGIGDAMRYLVDNSDAIQQKLQEWQQLEPFLEAELKKPEYNGITIDELFNEAETDENGDIIAGSLLDKALTAAKAAMLAQKLPIVTVDKVNALDYPLDKINNNIWKLLKDADKNGQITQTFAVEKRGSRREANISYSIDFNALEQETGVTITKQLTAFDKRVYIAVGALYDNGFGVLSVAQIYTTMGNTGRPNANDIKKINDSLTKMQAAHIFLSNEHEAETAKYKYDKFVYDASLLPMERISAVINGQTTDTAIHLFREPPLITFARERKQITTISRHLLESPLSKTDANLLIDDYLIERISSIKNARGKLGNKILYATIYEECRITSKMQRSRAPEKIRKYLTHYKECKFIKDYKEAADGITIIY